jgi:carbon storage regulator
VLVLTRREGQAIVIDGGIRLVVLSSDRRGVRIGIEAPTDISVLRAELVAEVASVNAAARDSGQSLEAIPVELRGLRLRGCASQPLPEGQSQA